MYGYILAVKKINWTFPGEGGREGGVWGKIGGREGGVWRPTHPPMQFV